MNEPMQLIGKTRGAGKPGDDRDSNPIEFDGIKHARRRVPGLLQAGGLRAISRWLSAARRGTACGITSPIKKSIIV